MRFIILFPIVVATIHAAADPFSLDRFTLSLWHFNEGKGIFTENDRGGGMRAKLLGNTAWISDQDGTGIRFNGDETKLMVDGGSHSNFKENMPFTFDCVLKAPKPERSGQIFYTYTFAVEIRTSGVIWCTVQDQMTNKFISVHGKIPVADNQKHRVTIVRDTIKEALVLFIDGKKDQSIPLSNKALIHIPSRRTIGGPHTASKKRKGEFFKGVLYAMHLSKTIRQGKSANALPAKTDDTILDLKLDEGKGEIAPDTSGLGNNGVIKGAKWVKGKSGMALRFDGDNDFINCGKDVIFDFGEHTDFTIEFSLKTTTSRPLFIVTKKCRTGAMEPGFSISLNRSHQVMTTIADGFNIIMLTSKTPVNDGTWHTVTLAADRDGYATLFVNGKCEARQSMKEIIDITNKNRDLRIGDRGHDGDFKGCIDNVRIVRGLKKGGSS